MLVALPWKKLVPVYERSLFCRGCRVWVVSQPLAGAAQIRREHSAESIGILRAPRFSPYRPRQGALSQRGRFAENAHISKY
jgi:hypothetical protein